MHISKQPVNIKFLAKNIVLELAFFKSFFQYFTYGCFDQVL